MNPARVRWSIEMLNAQDQGFDSLLFENLHFLFHIGIIAKGREVVLTVNSAIVIFFLRAAAKDRART
jgi:hypothetical protein